VDEGDTEIVKSKIFTLCLQIVLISLLCAISGLDAPEYVRCHEVGIDEFLEISANLGETHRSKIIMLKAVSHNFPGTDAAKSMHFIINRSINSSQEILFFLPRRDTKVSINTNDVSHPRESKLPSETLRFITTSIIRS
jgi:hypothetical protein